VIDLSSRAGRALASAALSVACLVIGPNPQIVAAMERIYAVQVVEDRERRRRTTPRGTSWPGPTAPANRRPTPSRPRCGGP
jgi:hypothetical protein